MKIHTFTRYLFFGTVFLWSITGFALAQDGTPSGGVDLTGALGKSANAAVMLFTIAVLLESAFSVLFNWRVFLTYFSLKGVRTIIMVAASYAIVTMLPIDIFAELVNAYQETGKTFSSNEVTQIITALILAGGSTGVNNMLVRLGYRSITRSEEVRPIPDKTKAWISIRVKKKEAVGAVTVSINKLGKEPSDDDEAIAGSINYGRPSLWGLIFGSVDRYPEHGGREVDVNKLYIVRISGTKQDGKPIEKLLHSAAKPMRFAPGAIIDLQTTL